MTDLTLSIATLHEEGACHLSMRVENLRKKLGREVPVDEEIPLKTWWSLETTTVSDMWWSLRYLGKPGYFVGVGAACFAVRRMLSTANERALSVGLTAIETTEGWLQERVTGYECAKVAASTFVFARRHPLSNYDYTILLAAADTARAASYIRGKHNRFVPIQAADALSNAALKVAWGASIRKGEGIGHDCVEVEQGQQRIDLYLIAFGETP
jgi:hypothetical protein